MNTNNILVCVTQQKTCERLIKKAAEFREEVMGSLYVLHVAKNGWNFLNSDKEGEALEYLFGISKSVGANLSVLKSDKIAAAIADFSRENGIGTIVIGRSPSDNEENSLLGELRTLVDKNVTIKIMP